MTQLKKKRTGQTGFEVNNLRRTYLLKIWLSDEEYKLLSDAALQTQSSSLAKYARETLFPALHQRTVQSKASHKQHLELLAALNRIGSNINQIARALNQKQQMTPIMQLTLEGLQDKLNLLLINKENNL